MRSWKLVLAVALVVVPPAVAESVDELLARYVEARGGRESLAAIDTVVATGSAIMGGGVVFPFRYEWKRPNRFRFELTIQGITEIDGFDGETAWTVEPPEEPEPAVMSQREFLLLNDAVDFVGPLVDAAAKGHAVELMGEEEFEGTPSYKLEVTRAEGLVEYTWLDADSLMEIAQQEVFDFDGQEVVLETVWSDYKEFQGAILPTSWSRGPRGGPPRMTLLFESVEINAELADGRFAMPEPSG